MTSFDEFGEKGLYCGMQRIYRKVPVEVYGRICRVLGAGLALLRLPSCGGGILIWELAEDASGDETNDASLLSAIFDILCKR